MSELRDNVSSYSGTGRFPSDSPRRRGKGAVVQEGSLGARISTPPGRIRATKRSPGGKGGGFVRMVTFELEIKRREDYSL